MLYVVFKKDGMGPRNCAIFKEEEWSDDDDDSETNFHCIGPTVDSSWVHTQPLVGHANDDVNCTIVTYVDADAYAYPTPTCMIQMRVEVSLFIAELPLNQWSRSIYMDGVRGTRPGPSDLSGVHRAGPLGAHGTDLPSSLGVPQTGPLEAYGNGLVVLVIPAPSRTFLSGTCTTVLVSLEAPQLTPITQYQESNDNIISGMLDALTEDNVPVMQTLPSSSIYHAEMLTPADYVSPQDKAFRILV
ncbi:hypothetical protein GQ457_04G034350 [Hibiscus cannabinus]